MVALIACSPMPLFRFMGRLLYSRSVEASLGENGRQGFDAGQYLIKKVRFIYKPWQAGHAVIQTLVGHGRFSVVCLSLDGKYGGEWRGLPSHDVATLDRQVDLALYEFRIVTLAGIAAENRYMAMQDPAVDPLVALSDLAEWQEEAWRVLQDEARIRLVGINVMRKLEKLFDDDRT